MSERRRRVFYGWWVVLTAALGLFLGSAPIIVFSFGVFLKSLSQEFHSGRTVISLAFTFHNLMAAISAPLAGRLVDGYGARRVILPCTVMFGLILLSSKACSGGIWQLYVFYVALGLVGGGISPVPYGTVVSNWFDRRRGLALGLMMFGLGFGALIIPSVAQRLIARFGWRVAYAAFGSAALLVSLPVVGAFLKGTPDKMGLLPDGATHSYAATRNEGEVQGVSWCEAWHRRTFWLMLTAFVLVAASVQGCFIHLPAMLIDRGSSAQTAALATSIMGGALLIGRVGSGYLLDRRFGPWIAAFFFGGVAVGIALLSASNAKELAFVAAFLIGLGFGAEVDILAYLISRYFGLRSFGEILGYTFAAFVVAGGLGALLTGAGFDLTGSYALPLGAFFIATLVAVLLMTRLGPYRYCVRLPAESGPMQRIP